MLKKVSAFVLLSFITILLVSCNEVPDQTTDSVDNIIENETIEYETINFDIKDFEIEVYELILLELETLQIENFDIVEIELTSLEYIEYDYFKDFVNDEIEDDYQSVNWEQVKNDLLIGTGMYLAAFVIRTATTGNPIYATIAFVSDVAIGLVFDFLIEIIPKIISGENVSEKEIIESLASGYKLGAIFDFSLAVSGAAFGSVYRALQRTSIIKNLAKTTGQTPDLVRGSLNIIQDNIDSITKNVSVENTAKTIKNNISNLSNATAESKKIILDLFNDSQSEIIEKYLIATNDKNAIEIFKRYKTTLSYKKHISPIKGLSETSSLKSEDPNTLFEKIIDRTEYDKLLNEGLDNLKALNFIADSSIIDDAFLSPLRKSQINRAKKFYFEKVSSESISNSTYAQISKNLDKLHEISINKESLNKVIEISRFDTNKSYYFTKELNLFEKSLKIEPLQEIGGKTRSELVELFKKINSTKNPNELIENLPSFQSKKIALDEIRSLIGHSRHKKLSESLLSEYLIAIHGIDKGIADNIARAQNLDRLTSILDNQVLDIQTKESLKATFGLIEKTDTQLKEILQIQFGEEIAQVIVDNRASKENLITALKNLENNTNISVERLNEAIMRQDNLLNDGLPAIDGTLKLLLTNSPLFEYVSTSRVLINDIVISRLKTKYRPGDVDIFQRFLNDTTGSLRQQLVNNDSLKRIALDYSRNMDLRYLNEVQKNNLLFSEVVNSVKNSRVYTQGLLSVDKIDNLIYFMKNDLNGEFLKIINEDNVYRELYNGTLIRRPDVFLELHNKNLIDLSLDARLDFLKKDIERIATISESNVDIRIRESAKYIFDNNIIEKLSNGDFTAIDSLGYEQILYHYNKIKPFVQSLDSETHIKFIDEIAKVRGDSAIKKAIGTYEEILLTLNNPNLSVELVERLEKNLKLLENYLTPQGSRFSSVNNEQFRNLYQSFGLTYDEAIQRFYTDITYTFNGKTYVKKFAKFDIFSESIVTIDSLVGTNLDFSRANNYIGVSFNPNLTTLHHTEDGLSLIYVNSDVHRAVIHDGGASLLRIIEELKIIKDSVEQLNLPIGYISIKPVTRNDVFLVDYLFNSLFREDIPAIKFH